MLDIKRGMKPKARQLISDFINKRIDYHLESLKILNTFTSGSKVSTGLQTPSGYGLSHQ